MNVSAIKQKPEQRPVQREALLRAHEDLAAEKFKLGTLEAAVGKAVALVDQRESELEKAHGAIEKARIADANSAAEGLKKTTSTPRASASRLSAALQEEVESGRRLEIARGALTKLEDDVDDQRLKVANAGNAVIVCTKYLLVAPLQKLYEETAELKKRLVVNQHVFNLLLATEHRSELPEFGAKHSLAGMRAQDAREEPLRELKAKVERLFYANVTPDETAAIDRELAKWRAALATLRNGDVDAVLPS